MSEKLREVYDKLEPIHFGRLECSDFRGVLLNRDDCILIVREIVKMELELKKLKKEIK